MFLFLLLLIKIFIFKVNMVVTMGQDVVAHAASVKIPGKIVKLDKLINANDGSDKKLKPKKVSCVSCL